MAGAGRGNCYRSLRQWRWRWRCVAALTTFHTELGSWASRVGGCHCPFDGIVCGGGRYSDDARARLTTVGNIKGSSLPPSALRPAHIASHSLLPRPRLLCSVVPSLSSSPTAASSGGGGVR